MELSDEARAWVEKANALGTLTSDPSPESVRAERETAISAVSSPASGRGASLIDDDGIVCLPPVRGEASAVDRLRALLRAAFSPEWSAAKETQLLKDTGCEGMTLEQWLRDRFFEQHVVLFHRADQAALGGTGGLRTRRRRLPLAGDHPTVLEPDHSTGVLDHVVVLGRDEKGRTELLVQMLQQLDQRTRGGRVEIRRWLVSQYDVQADGERAGADRAVGPLAAWGG